MLWCWVFGRVYGGAVAWVPFWETEITWLCCTQVPPSLLNRTDKHYIECQQVASGHFAWMKLHVGDQNEGIYFSIIVGLPPPIYFLLFFVWHIMSERLILTWIFTLLQYSNHGPSNLPDYSLTQPPAEKAIRQRKGRNCTSPFHPHSSFPSYSMLL